jgi:hypothetical protein
MKHMSIFFLKKKDTDMSNFKRDDQDKYTLKKYIFFVILNTQYSIKSKK